MAADDYESQKDKVKAAADFAKAKELGCDLDDA